MTNTQNYAKRELDILAATVPDSIVTPFAKEILALCEAFGNSGQSGGSSTYTVLKNYYIWIKLENNIHIGRI